jgi:hypothetical protein
MQPSESLALSVVIVNFRTPLLVVDCLATLLPEIKGVSARVVVVDNDSKDQSMEQIQAWLTANDPDRRVSLLASGKNGGFAYGNNVGIRAIAAQYYLLLNSDTLVRPGAIQALLDTASRYPEAGLFSPRLEWPDGAGQESCFRFHSPVSEMLASAQTGLINRVFSGSVVAMPVQSQIARPQWTSFACVMIRDEVFQKLGLLDEGYFMYFEDVEFCHRASRAGWSIVHNPEAHIVHLRGGSSPLKERARLNKRLPRYFYESRTRYFYQSYGLFGMVLANLLWWAGRLISGVRQLLGRSDKGAVAGRWLDIWTNWLRPLSPYTPPKP